MNIVLHNTILALPQANHIVSLVFSTVLCLLVYLHAFSNEVEYFVFKVQLTSCSINFLVQKTLNKTLNINTIKNITQLISSSSTLKFNNLRQNFLRCLMYFVHFCTSNVFQNSLIPSISSNLVCGFTSQRTYSFISCHKFSIGFISGDSAGVCHQLIPLSMIHFCTWREVCFGSLSCMYL